MSKEFKMIQELVKCLAGLDVNRIEGSDEEIFRVVFCGYHDVLGSVISDQMIVRAFRSMRPGCLYEMTGLLNVHFLVIYDDTDDHYLLAGPCFIAPLAADEILHQMRQSGLDEEVCRVMADYAKYRPVIPYDTLHLLGTLLARHLYDLPQPVPYLRLDYQWGAGNQKNVLFVDNFEELERMRRVEIHYESSAVMTEAVKQGNLSLAYQTLRQMHAESSGIVRNPNPLRNTQNVCIILNTQLRHAMESNGIHPYRLDRFSNEIAMHIEKLSSLGEASRYLMEIIRRYCELAREDAYPDLKPFTRLVVTYIKEHLSDNLTVKETAQTFLVNANYLSSQFHKDMGMTFIDFVNRERVNQAAALLKNTNMQIQQIAAAVGYNNTSYFAKQFMKYEHMTPRAYRNSGLL